MHSDKADRIWLQHFLKSAAVGRAGRNRLFQRPGSTAYELLTDYERVFTGRETVAGRESPG
jgi:hypothetical protein